MKFMNLYKSILPLEFINQSIKIIEKNYSMSFLLIYNLSIKNCLNLSKSTI